MITTPANISINNNNYKECSSLCDYKYDYFTSDLTYVNKKDYLDYRFIDNNRSTIKYNGNRYEVINFTIHRESLHKYNGSSVAGEIIIHHTQIDGSKKLLVCLPIQLSSSTSDASIKNSIVSLNRVLEIPAYSGLTTKTLNVTTFTLNDLVPSKKKFYIYDGNLPYKKNNRENYDIIVFSKDNSVYADASLWNGKIKKIINKHNIESVTNNNIFVNNGGSSRINTGGNDIYIECNPTGSDGEILISKDKPLLTPMRNIINNIISSKDIVEEGGKKVGSILAYILGALIFIGISIVIHILFSKFETYFLKKKMETINKKVMNKI
tara:strand:+ start:1173 stop:2141 length:969 start_codon:yes stop_codon:yes gene_type:complete